MDVFWAVGREVFELETGVEVEVEIEQGRGEKERRFTEELKESIAFNKHQKRIFIQRIFLRPLQISNKLTYNPGEIVNFKNRPDTEENQIISNKNSQPHISIRKM